MRCEVLFSEQLRPQPPQWFGSLFVLIHVTAPPEPGHARNPGAQITLHLPATQIALPGPAAGVGHTLPHPPQLSGSLSRRIEQPLPEPQSVQPGWQAILHTPVTHDAVAFAGARQVFPHAPQLVLLPPTDVPVCKSTHVPPQQVSLGPHAGPFPHMHAPAEHAVALGSGPPIWQAFPQAPQFIGSVSNFVGHERGALGSQAP